MASVGPLDDLLFVRHTWQFAVQSQTNDRTEPVAACLKTTDNRDVRGVRSIGRELGSGEGGGDYFRAISSVG